FAMACSIVACAVANAHDTATTRLAASATAPIISAVRPGLPASVLRASRQLGSIKSINVKAAINPSVANHENTLAMNSRFGFVRHHQHCQLPLCCKLAQQFPDLLACS